MYTVDIISEFCYNSQDFQFKGENMDSKNTTQKVKNEKLLRRPAVLGITALTNSTLYYFMQEGLFPSPVKLGKRTVAWKQSEIDEWINTRERSL